jgi:hypothetical protein
MFLVPIQTPQTLPQGSSVNIGTVCPVTINYDESQEFPNDPLKTNIAWVNCHWQVVGIYNGQ